MGGINFLAAVGFLLLAYEAADLKVMMAIRSRLNSAALADCPAGDDVRVSGIKVGQITAQELDPITYVAKVFMAIDPAIKIPSDSSARIAGILLGGNYLELMPGSAIETLVAGSVIYDTRDPVSLNDLLGKVVFQPDLDSASECPSQLKQARPNQSHDHAPGNNAPLSVTPVGIFSFVGPMGTGSAIAVTWIDGRKARLQALDGIAARISTVDAPVGASGFWDAGSDGESLRLSSARRAA